MEYIKIVFRVNGNDHAVEASIGDSLLEVAKKNQINLFGGCGGAGVCGTCHVLIDDEFIPKLDNKTESEEDLLSILPQVKSNSRLACQVIVSHGLEGMIIIVP
jgi:2Fe-2S ferredoxin